jgi:hypothetical protein
MTRLTIATFLSLLVTGCGGGATEVATDATGIVSIDITDAAVDDVKEVWVEFNQISLKHSGGEEIVRTFEPAKSINLLELQNGKTEALLSNTSVPVGEYNWMRIGVNAELDNVFDSYVLTNTDNQIELFVPSGSQTGLKLQSGFTVTQNMSTNLVIDWDLRKALHEPLGQPGMHLRPALRVTDMAVYGTLAGSVDADLTTADGCGDDAAVGNAVYIYVGEVTEPADIRGADTDPLVTASVGDDLVYSVTFLSEGEYTAAFTCQAELDDSEAEDEIQFAVVTTMILINDGVTTTVDFAPPPPS